MKKIILTKLLAILVSCTLFGQVYPNVDVGFKLSPDKDNQMYIAGKEFIYNYKIINSEGHELRAIKDSVGLSASNADFKLIEKIHLAVIRPIFFERTNRGQTEVVYSYWPNPSTFSGTGVVENNKNVWLHPPRTGFFKILETCPFPYIKYPLYEGQTWNDNVNVHDWWSSPLWIEWKGRLLFSIKYKVIGRETVTTDMGSIICWVIEAKAKSEKGSTKLISYFNENVGFVKLSYQTLSDYSIELELSTIIENMTSKGMSNYMMVKLSNK